MSINAASDASRQTGGALCQLNDEQVTFLKRLESLPSMRELQSTRIASWSRGRAESQLARKPG